MIENKEGHRWEYVEAAKWPGSHYYCIHCGLKRKVVKKGQLGYSQDNFKTYQTRAGLCLKP